MPPGYARLWATVAGARGSLFKFASQADLNAFDRAIGDWNAAVRQQDALVADWRERMNRSGLTDANSRL